MKIAQSKTQKYFFNFIAPLVESHRIKVTLTEAYFAWSAEREDNLALIESPTWATTPAVSVSLIHVGFRFDVENIKDYFYQ